jgi:NAD(P)H dehydrogenase (quinone)
LTRQTLICVDQHSVHTLAKEIVTGIKSTGASVDLLQIAETLSEEVLAKLHAAPKPADVPVLTDVAKLKEYDGVR